jgi:hypothetical protein
MSALSGSEDFNDTYREVLIDRCIALMRELSTEDCLRLWARLLEHRDDDVRL